MLRLAVLSRRRQEGRAGLSSVDGVEDLRLRLPLWEQSSRRLEESQRNIELVWLTGRLMPNFKTIADYLIETHGHVAW